MNSKVYIKTKDRYNLYIKEKNQNEQKKINRLLVHKNCTKKITKYKQKITTYKEKIQKQAKKTYIWGKNNEKISKGEK